MLWPPWHELMPHAKPNTAALCSRPQASTPQRKQDTMLTGSSVSNSSAACSAGPCMTRWVVQLCQHHMEECRYAVATMA